MPEKRRIPFTALDRPEETIEAVRDFMIAIKGPLTTPIGEGIRSLNVALRQNLTSTHASGLSVTTKERHPRMKHPELTDVVIFRENIEDVYSGIEWAKGSREAGLLIGFLKNTLNTTIRPDSGIGIKPISEFGSKRIVRKALNYAISNQRKSVTIVHKGNIMKFTEGAFKTWAYEVAVGEFRDQVVLEDEIAGHEASGRKDYHQRQDRGQYVSADFAQARGI